MIVYLAGANNQQQAEHLAGLPALLSFAYFSNWMYQYQPTFKRILIDSGAFSELNDSKKIDLMAYRDWSERWIGHADAIAGLDDIKGNYRRSLLNYKTIPWSFPTWHDSDPLELLPELVAMARERNRWIGIGLVPPRQGKERLIRKALELVPDDIHVHGWALRAYTHIRRIDSVDSTNWWRDAMKLRNSALTKHLTYGECLEIVVKRYVRWNRTIVDRKDEIDLFTKLAG
ncbi:MAG TPA: hypothetical protein VFC63_22900 [Blastocatellia bacterium]|nr:hypothetical protein [Blastocatellia bacterium]